MIIQTKGAAYVGSSLLKKRGNDHGRTEKQER